MLHLVNRVIPKIPVVLLDTGYLFPETYRFIDDLTERLKLKFEGVPLRGLAGVARVSLRKTSGIRGFRALSNTIRS